MTAWKIAVLAAAPLVWAAALWAGWRAAAPDEEDDRL